MAKGLHTICLLAAVSATLIACSIKEDRVNCPCVLTVAVNDSSFSSVWIDVVHRDKGVIAQKYVASDGKQEERVFSVPKGLVCAGVMTRGEGWYTEQDGLGVHLNPGRGAGNVFAGSAVVECVGEVAEDTLSLHKQWCHLEIILEAPEEWENTLFEVRGNWGGLSMVNLSPLRSDFLCRADRKSNDVLEADVLRQGDNTLTLKAYELKENGEKGRLAEEFPIGKTIEEAGFDWRRKDLDDVVILLSSASAEVSAMVVPWKEGKNEKEVEI